MKQEPLTTDGQLLNWHVSADDFDLIANIARRAASELRIEQRAIFMDLTAVHANGTPLDLARLAQADAGNFAHDIIGIARHLDRTTGQLRDCFVPRYHAKYADADGDVEARINARMKALAASLIPPTRQGR
jgi:hypothetical protein